MSTMTYQAASAAAQHMRELLTQFGTLNAEVRDPAGRPERHPRDRPQGHRRSALGEAETANFGVPLAAR